LLIEAASKKTQDDKISGLSAFLDENDGCIFLLVAMEAERLCAGTASLGKWSNYGLWQSFTPVGVW